MWDIFLQSTAFAAASVVFLGACIGSFLNVVVHRLPIMLERAWQAEARAILDLPELAPQAPLNLATPRSRCPHCGHMIAAAENIPLLSWLALRGKCSSCKKPISARYPIVEVVTALLSLLILMVFGPTAKTVVVLPFFWTLMAITLIDFDTQLIPDILSLPLLWAGLLVNLFGILVPLPDAVLGAVFGYLSLWTVFQLYKLSTGKEGMGFGDFKLLAALGAWMGWHMLPLIILLSSVVGAVVGVGYLAIRKQNLPFAFGPYLAMAGFIALLYGPGLMTWYLQLGKI